MVPCPGPTSGLRLPFPLILSVLPAEDSGSVPLSPLFLGRENPLPKFMFSLQLHPTSGDGRAPWSWGFLLKLDYSPTLPLPKSVYSSPMGAVSKCKLLTNLCLTVYFLKPTRGHKTWVWITGMQGRSWKRYMQRSLCFWRKVQPCLVGGKRSWFIRKLASELGPEV